MNRYRVYFLDWTSRQFLETGEPLRHLEYEARNGADALRKWGNHFWGHQAERIERVQGRLEENIPLQS